MGIGWNDEDLEWYDTWLKNQEKMAITAFFLGMAFDQACDFVHQTTQDYVDKDYIRLIFDELTQDRSKMLS